MKSFPAESVDLVVTDPPYGAKYRDRSNRTVANDVNIEPILGVFPELYRVLKPNTLCISFYGWHRVDSFFRAWRQAGLKPVGHIVWHKSYSSRSSFLHSRHEQAYLLAKGSPERPAQPLDDLLPWCYSGNKLHPTQKSVKILRPLIESFSKPGDLILDPFAGSGSTCVAAARTGGRYVGIELESQHCQTIRRRLAQLAGIAGPAARVPAEAQDLPSLFESTLRERGVVAPHQLLEALRARAPEWAGG